MNTSHEPAERIRQTTGSQATDVRISAPGHRTLLLVVLVAATSLGLAATDLVLPAIPGLPDALNGTPALAQWVMATYVAGAGAGLLMFGELGMRFDQRRLLVISLMLFCGASIAITATASLESLVMWRFMQGLSGAAAAVYAPGMIRAMFDELQAIRVLGVLGSIESLTPALAPVAGMGLVAFGGFRAAFGVCAIVGVLLCVVLVRRLRDLPAVQPGSASSGYLALCRSRRFMGFALSQAFCLGGLLIFVFGAPALMTHALGGSVGDFVIMQVCGIISFIIAANLSSKAVSRFGDVVVIRAGTLLSAAGALLLCLHGAFASVTDIDRLVIAVLFVPMNAGLGLRGPPGFYAAIAAAGDNPARGTALILLAVQLIAAGGTVLAAPFIESGLLPLASIAAVCSVLSVLTLLLVPPAKAERRN